MGAITAQDLDQLVATIAEKEKEEDAIAETLKIKKKEIAGLYIQATGYLKDLGRLEYDTPYGKVFLKEHWSLKVPQTPEDKEKLFSWMREKGIFEHYATVNSNSLKALYKTEKELAIKEGQDPVLFTLPGLEPATVYEKMDFKNPKRAKKEQSNE